VNVFGSSYSRVIWGPLVVAAWRQRIRSPVSVSKR
jgi:hypothetical protein